MLLISGLNFSVLLFADVSLCHKLYTYFNYLDHLFAHQSQLRLSESMKYQFSNASNDPGYLLRKLKTE